MKFILHLEHLFAENKLSVFFGLVISVVVLIIGFFEEAVFKTFVYLFVLFLSFIASEFYLFKKKPSLPEIRIKSPKIEAIVLFGIYLVGLVLLTIRFLIIDDFSSLQSSTKLLLMSGRILFLFPVALLIYFLGIKKYAFSEIGFKFKHWAIAIPILLIFMIVSIVLFRDGLQFQSASVTTIILQSVVFGLLTAALPEELLRHLMQSRFSEILNKHLAWIVVAIFWAATHIPMFAAQSSLQGAFLSSIGILPIGLFWGYLNQRYKSIIPAVILHSTNVWGLHNIF